MKKKKIRIIIICFLLTIIIFSYVIYFASSIYSIKRYDSECLPNTYIEEYDMSDNNYHQVEVKLDYYNEQLASRAIKLNINSNMYDYQIKDLGITIDKEKTIEQIKEYQKKLSLRKKLRILEHKPKKVFPFYYKIDDNVLASVLSDIKGKVDVEEQSGYFDTSVGVSYLPGVNGYSFDVEQSLGVIKEQLKKPIDLTNGITLVGIETKPDENEGYKQIDTMTSSFVTIFMPNTYLRNINLNTALGYINGSIVLPGEVFSYCSKAGPFNKAGYVFYYEFVGNGVCQIATTTYNAALLGGLEIVKRYPHAKKSLYVDGGLDATVASYGGGWCADMQFKNTYQYPIYIKAYSEGGRAHVEFWSNHDAKEGKEYTTSSTYLGGRGYRSYLHTWKDGQEIDVHEIATTWYTED